MHAKSISLHACMYIDKYLMSHTLLSICDLFITHDYMDTIFLLQDEVTLQATLQILHQSVQYQWVSEVIDNTDIYNCLEPFLCRADNLRWLSLIALYPLLPQLSEDQKQSLQLTQTDIGHLVQYLQNTHTFRDAVQLLTHAMSLTHNIKVLLENGVVELLAEFLDDQKTSEEDQDKVVLLIENMVTTDISTVDFQEQNLKKGNSTIAISDRQLQVATTCVTTTLSSFIQQLEGI